MPTEAVLSLILHREYFTWLHKNIAKQTQCETQRYLTTGEMAMFSTLVSSQSIDLACNTV